MGWGHGIINGKHVGYNIRATCDYKGCKTKIDRGLAYACGGNHGSGEDYCDGYFCSKHLYYGASKQLCPDCFEIWLKTPEGIKYEKEWGELLDKYAKK